MNHSEKKRIETLATQFRKALENCPKEILPVGFEKFPTGSCGDACLLLGRYLRDSGLGDFDYVLGEAGAHDDDTWHSHAWLQQGDLIVDITADQFADFDYPVVVTTDSQWHRKYRVKDVHPADYEIYDDYTRAVLTSAYRKVTDFLEKPSDSGSK